MTDAPSESHDRSSLHTFHVTNMSELSKHTVALIGLGTIGLSFAALHLKHAGAHVRLYDVRDDLEQHVLSLLPVYLGTESEQDKSLHVPDLISSGRIKFCLSLAEVCLGATIVQEQGPEKVPFKKAIWAQVVKFADPGAHFWSSTSGIVPSKQVEDLEEKDKDRLIVVHPYNPPHIIPLIEIVPSPHTKPGETEFAQEYFKLLEAGHRTVVIKNECVGFVGNRLSFALFREACHLVNEDVCSAQDIDTVMENCLAPRWSVAGPMKVFNLGGGASGISGFLRNLSTTVEEVWEDSSKISFKGTKGFEGAEGSSDDWTTKVIDQTVEAYGMPTAEQMGQRDQDLRGVLAAQPHRQ